MIKTRSSASQRAPNMSVCLSANGTLPWSSSATNTFPTPRGQSAEAGNNDTCVLNPGVEPQLRSNTTSRRTCLGDQYSPTGVLVQREHASGQTLQIQPT